MQYANNDSAGSTMQAVVLNVVDDGSGKKAENVMLSTLVVLRGYQFAIHFCH